MVVENLHTNVGQQWVVNDFKQFHISLDHMKMMEKLELMETAKK